MQPLVQVGLVAFGSACGGLLRWTVGVAAARWLGTALPYGTFFINITGSLFLGWLSTVLIERELGTSLNWNADALRLAVGVGFTGAYTTFSTFEWETYTLVRDGQGLAGFAYMAASMVAGLASVRLGVALARWA